MFVVSLLFVEHARNAHMLDDSIVLAQLPVVSYSFVHSFIDSNQSSPSLQLSCFRS